MNSIVFAVVSVTVIGVICSVILSIASKVMHVPVDERTEKVREALPGANCGACGYPGCDGYAEALTSGECTETNLCAPGGDAAGQAICDILGLTFTDVIEKVAVVKCGGECGATKDKTDYAGIKKCSAAKLLYGGQGECSYSCLGFGDCAAVCPNDAIYIEDGLAHIDRPKCIGCGLCAKNCPKSIITIVPDVIKSVVKCSNHDKGADVRAACSVGCIACKKCERECHAGAILVEDNLAHIDYDKCDGCGKCAEVCVTKCIQLANFSGIHRV